MFLITVWNKKPTCRAYHWVRCHCVWHHWRSRSNWWGCVGCIMYSAFLSMPVNIHMSFPYYIPCPWICSIAFRSAKNWEAEDVHFGVFSPDMGKKQVSWSGYWKSYLIHVIPVPLSTTNWLLCLHYFRTTLKSLSLRKTTEDESLIQISKSTTVLRKLSWSLAKQWVNLLISSCSLPFSLLWFVWFLHWACTLYFLLYRTRANWWLMSLLLDWHMVVVKISSIICSRWAQSSSHPSLPFLLALVLHCTALADFMPDIDQFLCFDNRLPGTTPQNCRALEMAKMWCLLFMSKILERKIYDSYCCSPRFQCYFVRVTLHYIISSLLFPNPLQSHPECSWQPPKSQISGGSWWL